MKNSKRFIFESTEKTLLETDDITELCNYINHESIELVQYGMMNTINYIHFMYHGYTLMIKKNYINEFGL